MAICDPVACTFVAQWRPVLELLYFVSGVLLLAGVVFAYLAYRSARQLATYRNTIDKFATYRNERDANQIGRVRELIESGALAGPRFRAGSIGPSDLECLRFVLNEWEEISLCVKYGIYSEQVLFEHYGRLGLELWTHLRPYIRHEQAKRPSKWAEFDRLAVKWYIRTSKNDQQPAIRRLKELVTEIDSVLVTLAKA